MVQDSYSGSHVKRNNVGEIDSILNYSEQNPETHATHDKGDRIGVLPGTKRAYEATKRLLELYQADGSGDFTKARNFLTNKVYNFSPGSVDKKPGGVELTPRQDK